MIFSLPALFQWIGIGQQVIEKGLPALNAVKAALAAHGIEADTAQLDVVIADADRRRALAEAESK